MTLEQHIMNEAVSYAQEILRLKDELTELRATTAKLREALLPMVNGTEWITAAHVEAARAALSAPLVTK